MCYKSISLLFLGQDRHEIQFWSLHSLDRAGGNQDTQRTIKTTDCIYDTQKNNFQLEVELKTTIFDIKQWQIF